MGSGDALLAAFLVSMERDDPIEEALATAVAVGTANAAMWEVGAFTHEDVTRILSEVVLRNLSG